MHPHLSERRTEDLVVELLDIQGWPPGRPPRGRVVRQNEYKTFPHLCGIFKSRSKTGLGDGFPDFLLLDESNRPRMVIETKADQKEVHKALDEACADYGEACHDAGHGVIAVGIAGQERTQFRIAVRRCVNGRWQDIEYSGRPISWIPTPEDLRRLLSNPSLVDLKPVVPRQEVLAEKAEEINRLLREAHVKDEYRPRYVGAMMLALWKSNGSIRREPDWILRDINVACKEAFRAAGKTSLLSSLKIDEANTKLAESAWSVLATLEKLNVVTASIDHDYLGQLYENFFRYTGGNTIGQYFTPRHVTRFMADLCEVSPRDTVLDPSCGTGGFLIAAIDRAVEKGKLRYEDAVNQVRDKLIGYESEPVTAALCVANMILRGDGKTGVRKADCFTAEDYPEEACQVVLMNPPFPHKKTDIPSEKFVERGLEALTHRGRLAAILPTSRVVKHDLGVWRRKILESNRLLAVCQLPDELFQPYASSTTSIILLEKGVPHGKHFESAFVRVRYDGLTLKKGARVQRADNRNDILAAVDSALNRRTVPGFSGLAHVEGEAEWSPGAYIPSALPSKDELKSAIDELLRRFASFYVRYAEELARMRLGVGAGELKASDYRSLLGNSRLENAASRTWEESTIGEFFDIYYGQKELHSRDGIPPGDSLIISPTEEYNGCYGWLTFKNLVKPPFITVAQTGSIGEAFVQHEPCGVNDDCLILLPKNPLRFPSACLFIAAAIIRLEKWRFNYGRKLTPERICSFKMKRDASLEKWVADKLGRWHDICEAAVATYAGRRSSLHWH